jgi:hypothetical protein
MDDAQTLIATLQSAPRIIIGLIREVPPQYLKRRPSPTKWSAHEHACHISTADTAYQVATADQAETDRYWNAIVGNGGQESACGWCKDKWGLSWQITPIALTKAITDPDRAAAKRAFDAMMQMKKIDIAAIEAACRG